MSHAYASEPTRVAKTASQTQVVARIRGAMVPCPQPILAGYRLVRPGKPDVHLVDPVGYRRRVPNPTVYCRGFRSWHGIIDVHDIDDIAEGAPFAGDTRLVQEDDSYAIYLLDESRTRALTSDAVMDKYWFDGRAVALVPQLLATPWPPASSGNEERSPPRSAMRRRPCDKMTEPMR
jgi:hypothetical protein